MRDPFKKVDSLLRKAISKGRFPGAVYLLGVRGRVIISKAWGDAVVVPEKIPATVDTIYDLASLAKALVTTTLIIRAGERGIVSLDDRVATFFRKFDTPEKEGITLRHLLTHTAGFPGWRPIYAEIHDRSEVAGYLARLPLESPPGSHVAYSDLGFICLSLILEQVYEVDFNTLARREIFEPLGLKATYFNPPAGLKNRIAGGELAMDRERDEARRLGFDFNGLPLWHREQIWGEIHDGNGYFLGGAVGHGGLFSTLSETYILAQQFLPGSRLFEPETLPLFSKAFTAGLNRDRSLGWMLASTEGCAAGRGFPPTAFGHTGFTGTSLWIDPHQERVYILFANRTHPRLTDVDMNEVRQQFHNLAARALDKM